MATGHGVVVVSGFTRLNRWQLQSENPGICSFFVERSVASGKCLIDMTTHNL